MDVDITIFPNYPNEEEILQGLRLCDNITNENERDSARQYWFDKIERIVRFRLELVDINSSSLPKAILETAKKYHLDEEIITGHLTFGVIIDFHLHH